MAAASVEIVAKDYKDALVICLAKREEMFKLPIAHSEFTQLYQMLKI